MKSQKSKFIGCLIGGAIGDALGGPVEFLSYNEIIKQYGNYGITDLVIGKSGKAEITDDTQMTLFTAEGLLTGNEGGTPPDIIPYVHNAYKIWLYTQGINCSPVMPSWLLDFKELFAQRAPGMTCISALESGARGTIEKPINDSKGCGGVMRVAPVGMLYNYKEAFDIGCRCAAITHGHPSGYISAGILACIISKIISGADIEEAIKTALSIAEKYKGHEECIKAVENAVKLSKTFINSKAAIEKIGEGWVGEEALAIAIYCSLKYKNNFQKAVIAAVNHDGDSDSTGAITGNILGAYLGIEKIPINWLQKLELNRVISEMANDIYQCKFEEQINM